MKQSILDVESWRASTNREMLEFLEKRKKKKNTSKKKSGSSIIFRTHLRPVDIYSYLKARFGAPNGMQNLLKSDDSDNIFHWDYNIKAGSEDVYIVGGTRQTHFHISSLIDDNDWPILLRAIKSDFSRVAVEKGRVVQSFEKWAIFQNKFAVIADNCAELHERILNSSEFDASKTSGSNDKSLKKSLKRMKNVASRALDLHGDCLKLRLLTPVMAEAFIALFILTFCKDEIRSNKESYDAFVRAKIPERIDLIYRNCDGVVSKIDKNSDLYRKFMTIVNKRNDLIHGNMDPEKDLIEIVYFEGRRPLFKEAGDHIATFFQQIEKIYDPNGVIEDYENTHLFLLEITSCLNLQSGKWFLQIMNDNYPGFEMRRKRVTRLFPSHFAVANFPGLRFDDELDVNW